MTLFASVDCFDFATTIYGAADTRYPQLEPVEYNFYDDVPYNITRTYTCNLIEEIPQWRHTRLVLTMLCCAIVSSKSLPLTVLRILFVMRHRGQASTFQLQI